MQYRVELTERATRDLRSIYTAINAHDSFLARDWFNGLEHAILSLNEQPARGAQTPEHRNLRHILYGSKRFRYRIIYSVDESTCVVTVLHVRHGSRGE